MLGINKYLDKVAGKRKIQTSQSYEKVFTATLFGADSVGTTTPTSSSTTSAATVAKNDSPSTAQVVKLEIVDSEADAVETQGDIEYILDHCDIDMKPDVYELKQQHTEAVMPPQSKSFKIECAPIIDNCEDDNDVESNVDIYAIRRNIDKTYFKSYKNSNLRTISCIDTKDIDVQYTDSDEDGYSDIDLDDDDSYQVLEGEEIPDPYDPEWANPTVLLRKNVQKFTEPAKERLLHGHIYFFHTLLDGGKKNFFYTVAESCNQRVRETQSSILITNFQQLTARDIRIFYAICLQMGSMKCTTLAEYWECETTYHGFDGFSSKMSLERFQTILQLLNFKNLQTGTTSLMETNNDELFIDLQQLLNFFNRRMQLVHECNQNLVMNEPIIYWKGKLNSLNELNEKFRRNAVMLHYLSEQSGLVLKLIVDRTEAERSKEAESNSKELAFQRLHTAVTLLEEKIGKGHTIFTSKYYSSYALCLELTKLGTLSSGILDSKRFGNSRELVLTNLKKMEFATKYTESIMMLKTRRHGKNLYLLSSDCLAVNHTEMKGHGQINLVQEINWYLKTTEMRSCLLDYQLALERTEIAWDKRLMIFIMNIIVYNSYKLYKSQPQHAPKISPHPDNITFEEYRRKIIDFLYLNPDDYVSLNEYMNVKEKKKKTKKICSKKQSPIIKVKISPPQEIHRPKTIKCSDEKLVKKRCSVCYKAGLLNFSQFCCDSCPGMPGLCEEPCFTIWHSKKRFK
ncbi:piggyBac transposable element-derived protein 4-like [Eurosta solidaginis]|uniref:piggyBac transposable element-derived protein 4-like n=1 Tax=Eurosta solidaginis TaxID=178769 RepID=UPI003530D23C